MKNRRTYMTIKQKKVLFNKHQALASITKRSFWRFCQEFWEEIPGSGILIANWHMEVICNELQDIAERIFRGEKKKHDLIINVSPGASKPVWEETPVLMANGLYKKLKNINKGDLVIGKSGEPCKVLKIHQQGNLPCIKVITESGREIITALDHPILTTRGWVEAKDITVKDVLAVMHKANITPSTERTVDEFVIAGYLIGDGSLTGGNCSLTNKTPDYIKEFCQACDNLGFGYNIRKAKNGVIIISLKAKADQNRKLESPRFWVKEIGLHNLSSKTKKIPGFVWKGTNDQVRAFLAAYFHCDGCVSFKHIGKQNISVAMSTISKKLAYGLQRLFLRLGINMRVKKNISKNGYSFNRDLKNYVYYTISVTNQDSAARFLEQIPLKGYKLDKLKHVSPVKHTFDQEYWPDPVKAIEQVDGTLPCRCLTVEKDQSFVANDIVVHNSSICSILYPAWLWTRKPDTRVISSSHTDDLVLDLANKSRNVIKSDLYQACFPDVRIREDQDTKGYYANSAGGDRKTCTIAGKSPTGFHAHILLCFPYETKIITKGGEFFIGEIVENKLTFDVLSYNLHENQFEWKPILTHMKNQGQELIRLNFSDGSYLSLTEEHPVYVTGKGFIPASSVSLNDEVIHAHPLHTMQSNHQSTTKGYSSFQNRMDILQPFMQSFIHEWKKSCSIFVYCKEMPELSKKDGSTKRKKPDTKLLQLRMLLGIYQKKSFSEKRKVHHKLSDLQKRKRSDCKIKGFQNNLLFQRMCQQTAFNKDEGKRELQLCSWKSQLSLSNGIHQKKKRLHTPSRELSMFSLSDNSKGIQRKTQKEIRYSSYQLRQDELQKEKSSSSLSSLSWNNAWESDQSFEKSKKIVSSIEREVSIPNAVYNLEVAENNNYFANGVLVHNCDDPIDPKKAISDVELKTARYFYDSVIPSRKVNKEIAVEITIMQRLHVNDPTGHLLERSKLENTSPIKHICLPAELTEEAGKYSPETVIPVELAKNYKNGLMDPKRIPREVLKRERATMGAYAYAGQYLQSPIPLTGGLFSNHYFNQRVKAAPYDAKRIRYWDRASTDNGGCYTAGVLLAKDREGNYYVEDLIHGQWEPHERNMKMRATALKDRHKYGKHEPVIWVEAEGGSSGRDAWKGVVRALAGFVVKEDRVSGSKEVRAEPWSAQLAAGNVYLVENGLWPINTFVEEHCAFPLGKTKDIVDCSCLIAGTKVITHTGKKNIEEIQAGEYVWTRNGFCEVLWSGESGKVSNLVHLDFGDNIGITGTPEHLIWTHEKGFIRMDSISASDHVSYIESQESWETQKKLSSSRELNLLEKEIITGEREEKNLSTELSGNFTTELSPRNITYITKTATHLIIQSKTLNASPSLNTDTSIRITVELLNTLNISHEFVQKLVNGINQKKVENGTKRIPRNVGENENLRNSLVPNAKLNLNPSALEEDQLEKQIIDFVQNCVMNAGDITAEVEKKKKPVCSVEKVLWEIEESKLAPENVEQNIDGKIPVYDLNVKDNHEFYANQILVHNSGAFNRLVGVQVASGILRTFTFKHNVKKQQMQVIACNKEEIENLVVEPANKALLIVISDPDPVGSDDLPLHGIASVDSSLVQRFTSHNPAEYQESWEDLIAPYDKSVGDIMMFPSHGKAIWSFIRRQRQTTPNTIVICDMENDNRAISIAHALVDGLKWEKSCIHAVNQDKKEEKINQHVYDVTKLSRLSVL